MEGLFATQVTGLLLCRKGEERLAFLAEHVSGIEAAAKGKLLRAPNGEGVGVDAVEVFGEQISLMPPPRLMAGELGGSLYGFVTIHETLYPVFRVNEFARFLSRSTQAP